jgi:hypothetical protein
MKYMLLMTDETQTDCAICFSKYLIGLEIRKKQNICRVETCIAMHVGCNSNR